MILSQVYGGVDEVFTSSGIRTFEPKGVQVGTSISFIELFKYLLITCRLMVGEEINFAAQRT